MAKRKTTTEDLARMVKKGFDQMATKEDLRQFATKEDLRQFATKEDLRQFATKEDLADFEKRTDSRFDHITAALDVLRHDVHIVKQTMGPLVRAVAEHEERFFRVEKRLERLERKSSSAR